MQKKKLAILLLLVTTCSFTFQAEAKRKPKWLKQRPIDKNFYIGIGMASKSNNTYVQVAKNNALTDLISEISVTINSESLLHQLEDNEGYKEKFEAVTLTRVKNDIEGFELVDSYEDKNNYWVYYRLSKADYERKKREIKERALNLAKDFYEKAVESEINHDYHNALLFYVKSFDAIKKHLGEDLSIFLLEKGKIYLDNEIYQSIQKIFSNIEIKGTQKLFELKALNSGNNPVEFVAKDSGSEMPMKNMPFIISLQDSEIKETVLSNYKGIAECTIGNMAPKGRKHILNIQLDIKPYFGEDSKENVLKNLFTKRGTIPAGNINIQVSELSAFVNTQETYLGEKSTRNSISNVIKEELSKNFFAFTDVVSSADVQINIDSKIIKGEKLDRHDLHTVYVDFRITILNNKNNAVIFDDSFSGLKGIKNGGFDRAAEDAIRKAEKKIMEEIIPNIRKVNL